MNEFLKSSAVSALISAGSLFILTITLLAAGFVWPPAFVLAKEPCSDCPDSIQTKNAGRYADLPRFVSVSRTKEGSLIPAEKGIMVWDTRSAIMWTRNSTPLWAAQKIDRIADALKSIQEKREYKDYSLRLPKLSDFAILIDRHNQHPALPEKHPFGMPEDHIEYITSTRWCGKSKIRTKDELKYKIIPAGTKINIGDTTYELKRDIKVPIKSDRLSGEYNSEFDIEIQPAQCSLYHLTGVSLWHGTDLILTSKVAHLWPVADLSPQEMDSLAEMMRSNNR